MVGLECIYFTATVLCLIQFTENTVVTVSFLV